jgi:hypothetical protein
VRLVLAAQNGSKVDLGSKEMQAQLQAIVGLGLDSHANKVLWGDLVKQGWSSAGLRNGGFLLRDRDHQRPEIAKGFFVGTRERRQTVAAAMDAGRPALEPGAWAALMGTDGHMVIDVPVVTPAEELDDVVRVIRDEYPDDGIRADDLCALPGMPARATVFRRLKRAQLQGVAESRDGRWYFIPPEQRAQDEELTVR